MRLAEIAEVSLDLRNVRKQSPQKGEMMKRDEVFCPGCGEAFAIGTVELSREHRTPKCWWCRELELVRVRAGMRQGEPMSERTMWEEIARRLAAYAGRNGATVTLKLEEGIQTSPEQENGT